MTKGNDRLPIPARPWELSADWFDNVARPWIDAADPDDLVSAWEQAVAADDLLDRMGQDSVPLRKATRWAERRIGVTLGDSKDGPRREIPTLGRDLLPKQKSQFRKMARVEADEFAAMLDEANDRQALSRAAIAKWCEKKVTNDAEMAARESTFDATLADAEGDGWKMLHGDFRDRLLELEPGSVDMIVTDPPYPAKFLPLWADLSEVAAKVLKPQGVLVGMTGKIHLDQVMGQLGRHLSYGWCYVHPLPGSSTRILARQVLQTWKPCLAFSNGPWPSGRVDWHTDTLDSGARMKGSYRWEQNPDPVRMLIHVLSDPGALVVDPFAGTAAFGVAALAEGRRFIGVELDGDRFAGCVDRLGGGS